VDAIDADEARAEAEALMLAKLPADGTDGLWFDVDAFDAERVHADD
jgi:hypothetical protein